MLQTVQAKTDATANPVHGKDKDTATEDLSGSLSTFYAQFMAALPASSPLTQVIQPATTDASPRKPQALARTDPAMDDAGRSDGPGDRSAVNSPARAAETAAPASHAPAAEASGQADPAAPGSAVPTDPTQPMAHKALQEAAATSTEAASQTEAATPAAPASTSPAKAVSPETVTLAKAQASLEQLAAGGKLQVQAQFGDGLSSKPALSELMNQLRVEIQSPSFAGVGSASGEPVLSTGTGEVALAPVQFTPMPAEAAALLNLGQPAKEPIANSPSPLGNFAAAEAVGAGAVAGANGSVRITATTEANAAAPVKRDTPMTQVNSTIKFMVKNQEQTAELQLHPESLGRVQIKLTVEGQEVHAKLWASEAAAIPVLQEHRAALEASLKTQGLSLGSFDLQHGHQSDQAPQQPPEPVVLAAAPVIAASTGQELPAVSASPGSGPHRISIVA